MIRFKSCPRCTGGDLVLDSDLYGQYLLCLRCGYMKDVKDAADAKHIVRQWAEQKERVAVPA